MRKLLPLLAFCIVTSAGAECVLRQSTAWTGPMGPFEDDTGSLLNALTISAGDVFISKNDAVFGAKADASACTFDSRGMYRCTFNATDTGTRGNFTVRIDETASGAMPFEEECTVMSQDAYDHNYGANNLYTTLVGVDSDLAAAQADIGAILVDTGTTLDTKLNNIATSITSLNTVLTSTGVVLAANSITAAAFAPGALEADAYTAGAITALQTGLATAAGVTAAAANVSVDEVQATALADFFNTNSGTTYAASIGGSVVREIVTNVAGGGGGGGDPWATDLPGGYSDVDAGGMLAAIHDAVTTSGVPISGSVVEDIWNYVVEPNGNVTAGCAMAIQSALIYGEYVQTVSSGVGQVTARDQNGTSVRLTASTTSNGRNGITIFCP